MASSDVKRLYAQFQPEHYALHLTPDREAMKFHGTVTITGKKVGRPSRRLTFHQNGLKITKASVKHRGKRNEADITVDRINHHTNYNEVRLHSSQMLYSGTYVVTLEFTGTITRNMEGIYPCFFTEDSTDKQLIATQFESHHARDAFPCIDEPEAKATFDLTLTTPKGEAVIANTPIKAQDAKGDSQTTSFETTPKMSTYLLAFVFGELSHVEAMAKNGTVVRVYATPHNAAHTQFALEHAVKALEFYNEYYDIPYPLAKCDFIALPDFASGAMENWGCITFREQALLVDPDNTSLDMKQYVANVIAHELTHQWFGNLVTMRWWTDLWLNEGFASWMSFLAVDHLHPEWQVWPQFIGDDQAMGLRADALEHTHPIEVPIHHPDEIRTIFDSISYDKGASVLHMLHNYLGADMFRDGLRHYLKKHAYGNTDGVDLWEALETVSGKPVREFMHAWISQPGFPILHAAVSASKIKLEQNRFYLNPEAKPSRTIWPIPLLPSTDIGASELTARSIELQSANTQGLILNNERSGFYRTVYDAKHLLQLGQLVAGSSVSPLNRYGILSDAAEAARAGHGSTVDALKLLEYYKQEDHPIVWDVIAGMLGGIKSTMDDENLRDRMKPYVRTLTAAQRQRLGWQAQPNEKHFDTLLRPTILSLSANADDPETLDEIWKRFNAMKQPSDINPDLRGIIYGTVAYHGDEAIFDRLLQLHNSSTNSEERLKLTGALTSFKQPELIDRALGLITTDAVRLQDVAYWIAYSLSNRFAKHKTWQWIQDNWSWLEKNIGQDLSFYRMPIYAARPFSDHSFLADYLKFFTTHMKPAFERNVKQGAETITWQAAWKERDFKAIDEYFPSN
jgi:aminopeptidase N